MQRKRGMLFIQGRDRPGIIQAVTGILFRAGANLEDVSMTILEGQFAMMISFGANAKSWGRVSRHLSGLRTKPWGLHTDLIAIDDKTNAIKKGGTSVLITAIGRDRTGIVFQVSSGLAAMKANITNLDCRLLRGGKKEMLYSFVLEVDLKKESDLQKINALVQKWQRVLKIEIKVHRSEAAVF